MSNGVNSGSATNGGLRRLRSSSSVHTKPEFQLGCEVALVQRIAAKKARRRVGGDGETLTSSLMDVRSGYPRFACTKQPTKPIVVSQKTKRTINPYRRRASIDARGRGLTLQRILGNS